MNKEGMNQKLNELKEKMYKLNDNIKDAAETAQISGMIAKDKIEEKMAETKGNLAAAKENYRINSEKTKSTISSKLLEAQMNIDVAKKNIADRKEAHDKEKLAKYIEEELEYANDCVALSTLAAAEAELAFLEALDAQKEYDEKYSSEE